MEWVITKDLISGPKEKSRVGTCSRGYKNECASWKTFRMLDDDRNVYYEGMATSESFDPLDDFGMPNDGCTEIQYRNKNGEWETL